MHFQSIALLGTYSQYSVAVLRIDRMAYGEIHDVKSTGRTVQ